MIVDWEGQSIFYTDEGAGDVLVFLHGLGGNCDNWLYQRGFFRETRRVISIDLPGHGRSSGRIVRFRDYHRAVQSVLADAGVRTATICGLSKGARVGLMLAAKRPDLVRAIVAINTFLSLNVADRTHRMTLYDLLLIPDGAHVWAAQLLEEMGVAQNASIVRGFMRCLDAIDPVHIHGIFNQIMEFDQRSELSSIGSPVLVLRGNRDAFVPAYCAVELKTLLANCSIVEMPGSGHLPYIEEPQEFNRILADFLDANHATPP